MGSKILKRLKRRRRIRAKVKGDHKTPRLSVFRSNKHIYAQIIDDVKANTLVQASDSELKKVIKDKVTKKELAQRVGELIASKALKIGIKKVVFDRGGYKYHGRVRNLAEGARKGGLVF